MAGWWAEAFITPTGIASTAAVGTPSATPGIVVIEVITPILSNAGVGMPTVIGPPQTITPTAIASGAFVGSPIVGQGVVVIEPTRIESAALVGEPTVTPGAVTIEPATIGSQAAVSEPIVSISGQVPYAVPFTI